MRGQFDIFKGTTGGQPLWVEAISGLEAAISRMQELALQKPGRYFVYSTDSAKVVATTDPLTGDTVRND
jgi:hypothetical protein